MSLINHSRGYSITGVELGISLCLLGTGIFYSKRHFQMLNRPNASQWHRVLGIIEKFPILGGVVALIEYALFRLGCFRRAEEQAPVSFRPTVETLTLDPSLKGSKRQYYIDLLKSKESEVRPFGKARRCNWVQCYFRDDFFFEDLQYVSTGEKFIDKLRRRFSPEKLGERALTWADLTFYDRPALYWAIYWQKLPFIESIVMSREGAKLLHRSYPMYAAGYPVNHPVIERARLEHLAEYPIHQAVRQSTLNHQSFPTKEAAEEASRNAMQIVLRLLELNANVNQADGAGRTPLHIALKMENIQMAKLLIKEGGTVRLSPLSGQMPRPPIDDETPEDEIDRNYQNEVPETLEEDKLQKLVQVYHDLDEEIAASTLLLPDLSKLILRYLC